MDGKRPGYDPRCCHKTVVSRCKGCPYTEGEQLDMFDVTQPVMVKLADVIDTIANVRSTIPAGQAVGAGFMQHDIIRHLLEKFVR